MEHRLELGQRVFITEPFGWDDSVQLFLELAEIVGAPTGQALSNITELFGVVVSAMQQMRADVLSGSGSGVQADGMGRALSKLAQSGAGSSAAGQADGMGRALSTLARAIIDHGGKDFVARVLATTKVVDAGDPSQVLSLSSPKARTEAFAGDIWSMWRVFVWVLGVNYSPFGLRESASSEGLLVTINAVLSKLGVPDMDDQEVSSEASSSD